jgi:hypothetical protein
MPWTDNKLWVGEALPIAAVRAAETHPKRTRGLRIIAVFFLSYGKRSLAKTGSGRTVRI